MSNEHIKISRQAAVVLTRWQAVQYTAAGRLGPPASAGDPIAGVVEDAAEAEEEVSLVTTGITYGIAGGVLTAAADGQKLMVNTDGEFVAYVAAAGNYHVANWHPHEGQTSAADGDQIQIQVLGAVADR